jgi:hypothetical protein
MSMIVPFAGAGLLGGCGAEDVVLEKSFTDRQGRACTYLLVQDWEQDDNGGRNLHDLDARNIDCDYPPQSAATERDRP